MESFYNQLRAAPPCGVVEDGVRERKGGIGRGRRKGAAGWIEERTWFYGRLHVRVMVMQRGYVTRVTVRA